MQRLVHLMSGLQVGGRARTVLQLARRGRSQGFDHRVVLYDTRFRNAQVDFEPGDVPLHFRPRRPGFDHRFVLTLAQLLRLHGTDIVHTHDDDALRYGCTAALRLGLRRPAVVATFHGPPRQVTARGRLFTRWIAERAGAVTAVSEHLARRVVDDGWVRSCRVVHGGVDCEAFAPRGTTDNWRVRMEIPPGSTLVGHIGRFEEATRHVDLLAAARSVQKRDRSVRFLLVGQGPLQDQIRSSAADLTNVHFVPFVADVAAFLREIDVFVLCSERAALPRVLMEAMACGCASVATDVDGVPELLVESDARRCGRLIAPGRPDDLAAAILELAHDPEACSEFGARSRARAAQFSTDREWDEYVTLYRALTTR